MRLNIFQRSTAGYLIVLFLLGGSNVYAILKLVEFNRRIVESHVEDTRILGVKKRLSDSFFSQRRYEQKYLITSDLGLLDHFHAARQEFERTLAELADPSPLPALEETYARIETGYERYRSLVETEVRSLRAQRPGHDRISFRKEKEIASDAILLALRELEERAREAFHDQTRLVSEAAVSARRALVVSFSLSVLLAILLSFLITRSITNPLLSLVKRTREISSGVYRSAPGIASPPEVAELSDAFRAMCERLKELDRLKADFLALTSHELKTPLTTIREGTALLLEGVGGATSEKQARLLAIIEKESRRLSGLVHSILDLSKMEAGMMNYRFGQAAIEPLIEQVLVDLAPYAEAKQVRFVRPPDAGGGSLCRMDEERIQDVLRNLLGNAVKFSPEGGRVTVAVDRIAGGIRVGIGDSGPGIPASRLETIFEKYSSFDPKNGTGLGLAIVRRIIVAHGGKVWAESGPDAGSRFIFVLPC